MNPGKIALGLSALGLALMTIGCNRTSSPSPAAGYDGTLICHYVSSDFIFQIDSGLDAIALFTTSPGGTAPAFVDSMRINGVPMEIDGDSVGYLASDFMGSLNFSAGARWTVAGANGIPSFTYNDQTPYPKYLALPDTIASTGYTFPINSTVAPGVDSMIVEPGGGPGSHTKAANSSSGGLSLTAADFGGLLPGDSTLIVLTAMSLNPQVISGKNFAFIKARVYYKKVIIK